MIVVDTSALYAILAQEADASVFAQRLAAGDGHLISAATYVELGSVCVRHLRDGDLVLRQLIADLPATVHPFDAVQADLAIAAYARYGKGKGHPAQLNLGDCFSYALARSLDAPLLYKGDDFIHTDIRSAIEP